MKALLLLLIIAINVLPQTYLNISFKDGSSLSSTDISQIEKITVSGANLNFQLTDNTIITKAASTINSFSVSVTNGNNPLPVELVSFTASVINGEVWLKWNTASESRNFGYDIEKAIFGTEKWEKSGFVKGSGNSNSPKEYSFRETPKGSSKFNYRLKQIDSDGKYQYSNIIEVSIDAPTRYELKQNYPNPFNPSTKIDFNIPREGMVTLKVYDILGSEMATIVNESKKAGSYEIQFDGSRLSSGLYLCKMSAGSYTSTIKMIIIK